MNRLRSLQTSLTGGQLSNQMLAREDTSFYAAGLATATNVMPRLQGGLSRRPGTQAFSDLGEETRIIGFKFKEGQKHLLCFRDGAVDIRSTVDGSVQDTITGAPWTAAQLFDMRYTSAGDTVIIAHKDFQLQVLKRTAANTFTLSNFAYETSGSVILQPFYKFADDSITLTPSATSGTVTLTTSSSYWVGAHVGLRVEHLGKQITITQVNSPTQALGACNQTLTNTSAATDWGEQAYSDYRGWPQAVVFHDRRLVIGGSTSLPQHIAASKTNAFFNFDTGSAADDDAIFAQLGTDSVNTILHLVSDNHLQIFTDEGEFYQPQTTTRTFTPANFLPLRQTENGSGKVRPSQLEGITVFVQGTERAVRSYIYSDIEQQYSANMVNAQSDNLLSGFDDTAVFLGDRTRSEKFVYYVDQTSGKMALYHVNRDQKIGGWFVWETDGSYWSVAHTEEEVFFVVRRTLNGVETWMLEKQSDAYSVDCGETVSYSGAVWGTATFLLNETVRAVSSTLDWDFGDFTTDDVGNFEYESAVVSTLKIGKFFAPQLVNMPISGSLPDGSVRGELVRVTHSLIELDQTYEIAVGVNKLQLFEVDDDPSLPPESFTDVFSCYHLGWSRRGQITITQEACLPMTMLSWKMEFFV